MAGGYRAVFEQVAAVLADGGAVDGASQTAHAGGQNQLGARIGQGDRVCGDAGIAAVVAHAEGQAEGAGSLGDPHNVHHAQSGFNEGDDGGTCRQHHGGAGNVVGMLGHGQHDALEPARPVEGFKVFGPVVTFDAVDAYPG